MKRRTFLSATGTIGIVGVASSATIASSVYNNVSTGILLEDFDKVSKKVLDNWISDLSEITKSLDLDSSLAKKVAIPIRIISIDQTEMGQTITYKNKTDQTILLTTNNGSGKIKVS